MKSFLPFVLSLCPMFLTVACGGGKPNGDGAPGSHCTVSQDCGCWDCECSDGVSPTNTAVNGRACETTNDTCLDGADACAAICAAGNLTSVSAAAGNDCAAP